jgi:endonuclease YncB( thermonuclease family)
MRLPKFMSIWLGPAHAFTILIALALPAGSARAANATVRDANTIQLGEMNYRLEGIDGPELDQMCLDDHADAWTCGVDAREQLTKLIGGRTVRCENAGAAKVVRKRSLAVCTVEGEPTSLNRQLVRQGFARNADQSTLTYREDEDAAKNDRRGLWKGCFASPEEFRLGKKDGALLGGACRSDKDLEIRQVLFPVHPAMPDGCSIKGKLALRARVTGNVGVYHLRGCRTYPALAKPDRWFCSEDDAQAAGFRRAYNCPANHSQ